MDCRKYFAVLAVIVAVNCKTPQHLEERIVNRESMVEVVQRLARDVNALKTDNQKLKVDNEVLKRDNKELKAEVNQLKNNGHSKYSVADQQWQAIHMAAAAACRGSTALGGDGPVANMVYPRTPGHRCEQVCKATKVYTECDAALSIQGYMGQKKSANQPVGRFYNYHCNGPDQAAHEANTDVLTTGAYLGYCCCRKP